RRKSVAAAQGRSRAGEEDGAAASRHHHTGRFASDQESRVAGELPSLEKQLFSGVEQGLVDIRSGIEEANLDRPDLLFDAREQCLHVRLLSGIDAEGVGLLIGSLQLVNELL